MNLVHGDHQLPRNLARRQTRYGRVAGARNRNGWAAGSLPATERYSPRAHGAGRNQGTAPEMRVVLEQPYCGGRFSPAHVKISFVSVL
jgi:hypothetical protein